MIDEEKGIEAIIYLQSLAGIDESKEEARKGWASMNDSEKRHTLDVYNRLNDRREKGE
jgi:hypothetical protein